MPRSRSLRSRLPSELRPSWWIRRWALGRGLRSDNEAFRFIGHLVLGGTGFLRARASRRGVVRRQPAWVAVARLFFVIDLVRRFGVKEVDVLPTETLRAGDRIQITSIPPRGRRGRRSTSA